MRRRPSAHSTTPAAAVPGSDDGVTDEARNLEIDRSPVEDRRSRRLSEASRAQNGDLPPHRERLGLVVRDEHGGRALGGQGARHRVARLGSEVCVEPGEGLVEQHDPRLRRERSREADAALLSTRELMGAPGGVARPEPDEVERFSRPGSTLSLPARKAEGDVLGDRQVGKQRTFLGDVADLSLVGWYVQAVCGGNHASVDRDRPAVGCDEADDQAQQRGLAASRRAEDRGEGPLRDDEVDLVQHVPSPVRLRDRRATQLSHARRP